MFRHGVSIAKKTESVSTIGPGSLIGAASLLSGAARVHATSAECASAISGYTIDSKRFKLLLEAAAKSSASGGGYSPKTVFAEVRSMAMDRHIRLEKSLLQCRSRGGDTTISTALGSPPPSKACDTDQAEWELSRTKNSGIPRFLPGAHTARSIRLPEGKHHSWQVPLGHRFPQKSRMGRSAAVYVKQPVDPIIETKVTGGAMCDQYSG